MNTQTNNATLTGHEIFLEAWNNATKIEFNPEWKNTTGYLDHVTNDPELNLEAGTFVATTDDYGRKVLIKGLGQNLNQVVFERGRGDVLVSNLPSTRSLSKATIDLFTYPFGSSLSKHTVEAFLGLKEHNVVFRTDFSQEFVDHVSSTTSPEVVTQLVKNIEEQTPILLSTLKEVGIDANLFDIYFNINKVNV